MPKNKSKQKWSQKVTDNSDALDLKGGVFKQRSAKKIAASLRHSPRRAPAKGNPVPIGHVDVDLLHQPRWQAVVQIPPCDAGPGQG
jgi:hypothetical protein